MVRNVRRVYNRSKLPVIPDSRPQRAGDENVPITNIDDLLRSQTQILLHTLILWSPQDTVEAVISFELNDFYAIETYSLLLQQLRLFPIGAGPKFKSQGSVRTYHPKPG